MYAKILISVIGILIVIGTCQPMPPNTNMMPGVFISSETLKSMEDKARINGQNNNNQMQHNASIQPNSSPTESGNQQSTNYNPNQPNTQMNSNSEVPHAPVYQVPTSVNNQQPTYTNQQATYSNPQSVAPQLEILPMNTQRQQMSSLPIMVTQPQNQQPLNQQPMIMAQQPNQQYVLTPSNEPNQQTILVSQPNQQAMLVNPQNNQPLLIASQNNPLLVNSQSNQPLLVNTPNNQPLLVTPQNQPLIVTSNQVPNVVVQNGVGQPVVSNPNVLGHVITNQNGALVSNPLQNSGNQVYAIVPLNNQNVPNNNVNNGNTYLVPVQQVPSNTVLVNTGK